MRMVHLPPLRAYKRGSFLCESTLVALATPDAFLAIVTTPCLLALPVDSQLRYKVQGKRRGINCTKGRSSHLNDLWYNYII